MGLFAKLLIELLVDPFAKLPVVLLAHPSRAVLDVPSADLFAWEAEWDCV